MDYKPFEELTEEEKKKICNGCGAKGGWIVPPHAIFFETSCDHHDYGYWKGGTEADRKNCDIKLREAMIKDCEALPWHQYIRYRPWCELYYIAVRLRGWAHFNYT